MEQNILTQINKVKQLEQLDKNSQECIDELNYLNTLLAESEQPYEQIKHLPTVLKDNLLKLEKQIKLSIIDADMREDFGSGYYYGCC